MIGWLTKLCTLIGCLSVCFTLIGRWVGQLLTAGHYQLLQRLDSCPDQWETRSCQQINETGPLVTGGYSCILCHQVGKGGLLCHVQHTQHHVLDHVLETSDALFLKMFQELEVVLSQETWHYGRHHYLIILHIFLNTLTLCLTNLHQLQLSLTLAWEEVDEVCQQHLLYHSYQLIQLTWQMLQTINVDCFTVQDVLRCWYQLQSCSKLLSVQLTLYRGLSLVQRVNGGQHSQHSLNVVPPDAELWHLDSSHHPLLHAPQPLPHRPHHADQGDQLRHQRIMVGHHLEEMMTLGTHLKQWSHETIIYNVSCIVVYLTGNVDLHLVNVVLQLLLDQSAARLHSCSTWVWLCWVGSCVLTERLGEEGEDCVESGGVGEIKLLVQEHAGNV